MYNHDQKQNHSACTTDVGVEKVPMHCISRHSMLNDIMGKATDLSDFDKVKSL